MSASAAADVASPSVVWLRQDLRLADHPAFTAAAQDRRPVLALFVLDDETPGRWALGGASRWWLHHSLQALGADLAARGGALILRRGRAEAVVPAFAAEVGAAIVRWTRSYEPFAIARDTAIKQTLKGSGRMAESHEGALLIEPWRIKNGSGSHFKVFSPFHRALRAAGVATAALPAPDRLPAPPSLPPSDRLTDWGLLPTRPDWAGGLRSLWRPGEAGAGERLQTFIEKALRDYPTARNIPGGETTSRLSPHLHFGELSPAAAWRAADGAGSEKFQAEIGWREFSAHLLYHHPDLPERTWKTQFEAFPWREDPDGLEAWRRGRTGYPIVDAGMRELWTTGWMHNRVRMIVASFLCKHLLIDWRRGQDWFWDTLVDADLASNSASWQWVAGSGADAAPYFRIFNPVSQGETYDPEGRYVRKWVPELGRLPDSFLHKPWAATSLVLKEAGVRLGETYPHPLVDHAEARARALAAYEVIRLAN